MRKLYSILGLIILLLLTACGGGSGGQGDSKDKSLRVYSTNKPEEMEAFTDVITEGTGIDLEVLTMSSGEVWSRAESEAPHFGADMQIGMLESFALEAVERDYVEAYQSDKWDDVPEKFKDPDGKWYGTSFWYNTLIINDDIFEEKGLDIPETWEDLLDPQYEGEIILPDPGTAGTAYLFTSTIIQLFGEEKAWDYFEALDKNVAQYTKSGSGPALNVAQGEYAVGITWDQPVSDFIEEGYPVSSVIPSDKVGFSLDVSWIYKGTDKLELAQEVIDYMATEEFMEKTAEYRSMVTKPGITDTEKLEENFIDYDAVEAAENKDRIMSEWQERFSN